MINPIITADKTPWYQWDTGLTVTVAAAKMTECHFANRKQGTAYVQAVINGVARVPDELLQVAAPIKAYGYVSDGAGGQTYIEETFEVIARNIPADYTYTKTAQKTIRDAEAARDEAVQAAKDAKASELAADDSAVEASNSAQSAGESASAAATSASNAAKSAGDAATSASEAKAAASKTVEDASALLKTYTDNAKTSADNAAASASNAADAASAASDSASAAEHSATDASNAKAAAQTAKAEAETSASNAATSASNAESSATAAKKSASDAAASVGAINVIAPKTIVEGATAPSLSFSAGYGASCSANANYSVAIGNMAEVSDIGSIAIGSSAISSVTGAVALGDNAKVNHHNSAAIASHSETTKENEFSIGSADYAGGEYTREITHVSTPTAPTSAATKKYTDDNDAKTLSEAKKYTDANTSNALVGTVSGKLLHVEDAWPSKLVSLTIEGAYKQDGTPSPDNPVPIEVIENPTLHVTGRNIVNVPATTVEANSVGVTFPCGLIPSGTEAFLSFVSSNDADPFAVSGGAWGLFDYTEKRTAYTLYPSSIKAGINRASLTPNFDATKHFTIYGYCKSDVSFDISNYQLEVGGYHDYKPHTSASLPITLPAEHPYLAALHDGTHDEIIIDKDGNASLVARVMRSAMPDVASITSEANVIGEDGTVNRMIVFGPLAGALLANGGNGLCTRFVNSGVKKNRDTVRFGASNNFLYLYTSNEDIIGDGTKPSVETWFAEHQTSIVYPLSTSVTYPLGKLDIPSLPETISNVWTDAELTTNTSMTYKRDINIAFENLTQAVVAAAAGE